MMFMNSAKDHHRPSTVLSAGEVLQGADLGKLDDRRRQYAQLRMILSENIGDLAVSDGFDLTLQEDGTLDLIVNCSAHAELVRQMMPVIEEALGTEGIRKVRLKRKPA